MIYIISDTHFGHSNIIKYSERNFLTLQEMNDTLIENWNKTVSKKDTIYHLGDFAFGKGNFSSHLEYVEYLVGKLNGKKILIKGNHDNKSTGWYIGRGFDIALDDGIILEERYLLTHKPMSLENKCGFINIHGHTHQNNVCGNKYYNVSVEQTNYTPISLDRLKMIINKK